MLVLLLNELVVTGHGMNTLTLKIPQTLDGALQMASTRRRISKSAVVREALERTLTFELKQSGPASAWLERWRGSVREASTLQLKRDSRMAHILAKHLR